MHLYLYFCYQAADLEDVMFDWIGILRTKLTSLNILNLSENLYSKNPISNSELPPQQAGESDELYEPIFDLSRNIALNLERLSLVQHSSGVEPLEEGPPPYEHIFSQTTEANVQHNNNQRSVVSFREAQVEKLKREMAMISGLSLKV